MFIFFLKFFYFIARLSTRFYIKRILKKVLPNWLIISVVFLLLWQALLTVLHVPSYVISTPLEVLTYIKDNYSLLLLNTSITIFESLTGLLIATTLVALFGLCSMYCKTLSQTVYKIVLVVQIVPLIAVAPLLILWLGFGVSAKIFITSLFCLFPLLVAFFHGCSTVDKEIIEVLVSLKASRWQIFKHVFWPAGLEGLFSGLKIAVTYSLSCAIVAEYLGSEYGIGIYITRALSSFNTAALFTNVCVVVAITLLLYKAVTLLEPLVLPWRKHFKAKVGPRGSNVPHIKGQ